MGLIKSNAVTPVPQPFSMRDIEMQAKALIVRARQRAEEMLKAAVDEAGMLRKESQALGFVEGRAEGVAKGREEGVKAGKDQALTEHKTQLSSAFAALTKAAMELEKSRRDLEAAALKDVLNLSIAIAERVTKRQGVLDPAVAVNNVGECLKLVSHSSDVRIAIHPKQKSTLAETMPRLKLQWPTLKHVELVEDDNLAPGGCRIFTAQGEVDGDLDQQINRVVADLLPERQEAVA